MTVALIVAAGRGERLGADRPKALVELAGQPLVQWSIDALRAVDGMREIVVALPAGTAAPSGVTAVAGGAVRSESVRIALAAAAPGGDPAEAVVVHDAARPLVSVELVQRVLDALDRERIADAAIAALPCTDTVKRADGDGLVAETLDRSSLWAVQTPQVFRRDALERAVDVPDEILARATDDAWLIERIGGRVLLVPGGEDNLKVTTALDMRLAELLLAARAG
jgi:2-C-methyl-D-erythritol 4-phosphate cytidylyltransferase